MNGCNSLGTLEYKEGNKSDAVRLFKKACEGGEMDGCNNLGALEEEKAYLYLHQKKTSK